MNFKHPFFLAGFRPFFLLAILAGVILPVLWAAIFSGYISIPSEGLGAVQWHAHEMLFGFGWAVLGGFLLTSSKNWVGVRGIHGGTLALAALLWIGERLGIYFYSYLPELLRWASVNLFIVYVSGYILWTLFYYRKKDSFPDNFIFMIVLPLFIIAKNLTVSTDWYFVGWTMTMGLFRVAFVVMFERTITQFMKNSMGLHLLRNFYLDSAIKLFAILSVFEAFYSENISAIILGLTAVLLGVRFIIWKPLKGFSNFGIGLSYLGYLGLTLHFFFEALKLAGLFNSVGSLSVHIFTFLCMGIVIPAMIIRIAQGHTGRKLLFTRIDRIAILSIGIGAFFRLIASQLWPQHYSLWIDIAALSWAICFLLIGFRLIPFLFKARLDGREH